MARDRKVSPDTIAPLPQPVLGPVVEPVPETPEAVAEGLTAAQARLVSLRQDVDRLEAGYREQATTLRARQEGLEAQKIVVEQRLAQQRQALEEAARERRVIAELVADQVAQSARLRSDIESRRAGLATLEAQGASVPRLEERVAQLKGLEQDLDAHLTAGRADLVRLRDVIDAQREAAE